MVWGEMMNFYDSKKFKAVDPEAKDVQDPTDEKKSGWYKMKIFKEIETGKYFEVDETRKRYRQIIYGAWRDNK